MLREQGYLPDSPDGTDYREACQRRVIRLESEHEVCGICVRACWEAVRESHAGLGS